MTVFRQRRLAPLSSRQIVIVKLSKELKECFVEDDEMAGIRSQKIANDQIESLTVPCLASREIEKLFSRGRRLLTLSLRGLRGAGAHSCPVGTHLVGMRW